MMFMIPSLIIFLIWSVEAFVQNFKNIGMPKGLDDIISSKEDWTRLSL